MLNKLKSTTTIVTAIILATIIFAVYSIFSPIPSATVIPKEEIVQSVSSARSYSVSSSSIAAVTFKSSSSSSSAENVVATIMAFKERLDALNSRQTRGEIVEWYYRQGIFLDTENFGPAKSQYSTYNMATLTTLVNNGDREAMTEMGKRTRKKGDFEGAKATLTTAAAMGSLDALRELALQTELELNRLTRRSKTKGKGSPEITPEQLRSKQLEVLALYDALEMNNDILYTQNSFNARSSKYTQYAKDLTSEDKNLLQTHLSTFNNQLSSIRGSLNITQEPRPEMSDSVKAYTQTVSEFIQFCAKHAGACEKTLGSATIKF
jgi:hypothetical protein